MPGGVVKGLLFKTGLILGCGVLQDREKYAAQHRSNYARKTSYPCPKRLASGCPAEVVVVVV